MKKISLLFLVAPILLSGCSCSNNNESHRYQAINDQQSIMKEYYSQHKSNQSSLAKYTFTVSSSYDPTYDLFNELAPVGHTLGLFYELNYESNISIYSGYFIKKNVERLYVGNKENVGSIDTIQNGNSYWFRKFDEEGHDNKMQLIHRTEKKENDLANVVIDQKTDVEVDTANISNYFANNINTEFETEFEYQLHQPISTSTRQVSAYSKSDNEVVEVYSEVTNLTPINNPLKPGDEYKLAVVQKTEGETTFKKLESIGWVATSFKETITTSLVTDYELKLLESPHVIKKDETTVTFSYSTTPVPYSDETFIYHSDDTNPDKLKPLLFRYENEAHYPTEYEPKDVTKEYKILHPEFSGYAFQFDNVKLFTTGLYSFATKEDYDKGIYETIGYKELSKNAGGTLISAGVSDHNLFTTLTDSQAYEFLILFSSTGTKTLIAHFHK